MAPPDRPERRDRQRARRRPAARLDDIRELDQPVSPETPEETYLDAERSEELRRLVSPCQMPSATPSPSYAAGLSAKEIGQVIGKSEAASQKLIQRALIVLREARHVDA